MIFTKADGTSVTELAWVPPTTRADGSSYGTADHAGYELGTSDPLNATDGFTAWVSVPATYDITTWPLDQLNMNTEGDYEVGLRVIDTKGRQSVWSNPALFTAALANPDAPTGLNVL